MSEDLFQQTKSDFFQNEYLPGRAIPEYCPLSDNLTPLISTKKDFDFNFYPSPNNTLPWITVIYESMYFAERASKNLPLRGLNVYYPKTRYKEKEIQAAADANTQKRMKHKPPAFVPAYGRYLFIQLVNDPLFEQNQISENMLSGRFNENGVVEIMAIGGQYSLTLNLEILENDTFHKEQIKKTDPRKTLRFKTGEIARVVRGNLNGYFVTVCTDIYTYFKPSSKTEVQLGNAGARHYVKVGDLEKC